MRTIYHDAILPTGKYKGRAVEDILREDPAYFMWCFHAKVFDLDTVIVSALAKWSVRNNDAAEKAMRAGQKAAMTKSDVKADRPMKVRVDDAPSVQVGESVTSEVSFVPRLENVNWGTW